MHSPREARFELRNDLSELARARKITREFIGDALEARDLNRVVLAIDEALANIMEHAYPEDPELRIQLEMRHEQDRFVFVLEDEGEFFDPTRAPLPDLKEHAAQKRDGGLGIYLFTTLLETTHEVRPSGGNRLRLEKNLSGENAQ